MSVDADESTVAEPPLHPQDEPPENYNDERDVVQRQGWSALSLSFTVSSLMTVCFILLLSYQVAQTSNVVNGIFLSCYFLNPSVWLLRSARMALVVHTQSFICRTR